MEPSIERLVECHLADVYRYAYRLTGNAADAEDLTQQVFLTAHRHVDQIRDASRAAGWLLRIARNTYFKQHRRQRPVTASSVAIDVDWFPDQRSMVDRSDAQAIQAALDQLDDDHRQVILMFYFENLSYRQIASQIDVRIGTVMSRLSRAKSKLREVLASGTRQGGSER